MIYITFERGGPKFSNTTTRTLAQRTAVQQCQLRAKWLLCSTRSLCVREFIKTDSATAVQWAFLAAGGGEGRTLNIYKRHCEYNQM